MEEEMPVVSSPNKGRGKSYPTVLVLAVVLAGALAYIAFSGFGGKGVDGEANADASATPSKSAAVQAPFPSESAVPTANSDTKVGETSRKADVASGANGIPEEVGRSRSSGSPSKLSAPAQAATEAEVAEVKMFDNDVEDWLEKVSRNDFESLEAPRVNMSQDEIVAFLKQPVDIYDEDDDETIAAKERTAEVKAQALQFIEDGGTLNQFLRDYAAQAKEGQETVKDVRDEMLRIFHDEGIEAAQEYLDKANPQLREQGLKEVVIGKGTIKMMERRKAREARDAARQ